MEMTLINSIKHPKVVLARELNSRAGRSKHGKILLEGAQAVNWALEHGIVPEYIVLSPDVPEHTSVFYRQNGIDVFCATEGVLKKITDTKYLIPVIGVAAVPCPVAKNDFVLVLDDVKDFGNIGTIARTASAFGVTRLLSTNQQMDLFYKKTVEASRGKVFAMDLKSFNTPQDTIGFLHQQGYQVVATSPHGNSIQSLLELDERPVALVAGNETNGICEYITQNADHLVQIPMSGQIESLNVGVATGISLYELKLKQVFGMIEKKIKSTLGREVNVAAMLIQQALNTQLAKISTLSSRQVVFLMVLKCDSSMEIEHMQHQFSVDKSATQEFLAPLTGQKLITVQDTTMQITTIGEQTLAKLWTVVESTEEKIMEGLSQEEKQLVKSLLKKIQQNCATIINAQA